MKTKTIIFIAIICVLAVAAVGLYVVYEERGNKILELQNDVLNHETIENSLSENVAEQEKQIESLTADVSSRDSKIGELENSLSEALAKVDTTTADLAEKAETIQTLNADIEAKSSQIETLTSEADTAKESIRKLEEDVAAKAEAIEKLEAEAAEKEKILQELNENIAGKEQAIEELKGEISNLQTLVNRYAGNQEPSTGKAEDAAAVQRPKVTMEIGTKELAKPETVSVVITVANEGTEAIKAPELLYPDSNPVKEFSTDALAAGETRTWEGEWAVTQKELELGKVTFILRYTISDGPAGEDGKPTEKNHKLNFSKAIKYTGK